MAKTTSADAVYAELRASIITEAVSAVRAAVNAALDAVGGEAPKKRRKAGRKATGPVTKWVADDKAKRVPNFVIKATKLKTKAAIIAKYGPGAKFEEGKPLPAEK